MTELRRILIALLITASAATAVGQDSTPLAFVESSQQQRLLRDTAIHRLNLGDQNRAIAALLALSATPEMSETKVSGLLLLSDLYRSEGEVERGLGVLERLSEEAPAIAELEFVFGRYLGDLERYTEAEAHLLRAIDIKPEMLQSYLVLGSLYAVTERTDEGAIMFGRYENVLLELLSALADGTYTVEQRVYVLASLLFASPDERITRAVADLLDSDGIDITVASIQLLSEIGTVEGIPALEAFAAAALIPALAERATHAADMIRERGQ